MRSSCSPRIARSVSRSLASSAKRFSAARITATLRPNRCATCRRLSPPIRASTIARSSVVTISVSGIADVLSSPSGAHQDPRPPQPPAQRKGSTDLRLGRIAPGRILKGRYALLVCDAGARAAGGLAVIRSPQSPAAPVTDGAMEARQAGPVAPIRARLPARQPDFMPVAVAQDDADAILAGVE